MADEFAPLSKGPCYAVIFTSKRADEDPSYDSMATSLFELASEQPGYLGVESSRSSDGFGITVSYFDSAESILAWKQNVRHLAAQRVGKELWYEKYIVRIAKIEREYSGSPTSRSSSDAG